MSRFTHYFVVAYNEDTGFTSDTDTLEARFSEGVIWDEEEQEWVRIEDPEFRAHDASIYSNLLERLR